MTCDKDIQWRFSTWEWDSTTGFIGGYDKPFFFDGEALYFMPDANDYPYPALAIERKSGDEPFLNGNCSASLSDFWAWAYSDLMGNTGRGKLAEYIVSLAMMSADGVSEGWGVFDILSPEKIKIEVKTSAYLQSWAQKKVSGIRFSVRETLSWDSATNAYAVIAMRQADVYVFCVESCKDQDSVNPLDLSQWDFYPIATKRLNSAISTQKTIGLNTLLNLGAKKCSFNELRDAVLVLVTQQVIIPQDDYRP